MQANPAPWRIARASVAGTRHVAAGQGCQDASRWAKLTRLEGDVFVAAVADGLGSAPDSARGSRIAVDAAVRTAAEALHAHSGPDSPDAMETILYRAVLSARESVQTTAWYEGASPREFATTLLLAIHASDAVATAQIGDGAAVVSTGPDDYVTVSAPQRGEYANETHSVVSRRALQACRIDIAKGPRPVKAVALMTDGLTGLTVSSRDNAPHPPFFRQVIPWLLQQPQTPHANGELAGLLRSERITSKTDDDVTLLLSVRP